MRPQNSLRKSGLCALLLVLLGTSVPPAHAGDGLFDQDLPIIEGTTSPIQECIVTLCRCLP